MAAKIIPDNASLIPDEAERVFKGVIYDVYHWQQELFDGSKTTFEMLRRADTVSAICVVGDKLIVLQDEQPHRGVRVTFPGGRSEDDEDPLTAIQREVAEETGYSFRNWRLVQVTQPHTKIEWFVYLFLAWDGGLEAEPHVDAGEKILVKQLPFEAVRQMVLDRVGYLGESRELFSKAFNLADLLATVPYAGRTIALRS